MQPLRFLGGFFLIFCVAPVMFVAIGLGADGLSWPEFIVIEFIFAGGPLVGGIFLVSPDSFASRAEMVPDASPADMGPYPPRAEMGPDVPRFLSPQEVAARLDLSEKTIWEAIRGGELPAIKIGSRRWIRESDLQVWVLRHH